MTNRATTFQHKLLGDSEEEASRRLPQELKEAQENCERAEWLGQEGSHSFLLGLLLTLSRLWK